MYSYTDYMPPYLHNVREIRELGSAIDSKAQAVHGHMEQIRDNQFVDTCDAKTLRRLERLYQIYADPVTESMEFRRARLRNRYSTKLPLTMQYLISRLDEIIGAGLYRAWISYGDWHCRLGTWRLGSAHFRDDPYVLHVETVTDSVQWYQEVHILVNRIKPANIVFSFSPMVSQGFAASEAVGTSQVKWHCRLGSWRLSNNPFREEMAMEVVKVPAVSSIQTHFLEDHARHTAVIVAAVRINGTHLIDEVQTETAGTEATIRYIIPLGMGVEEITGIELLGADGEVFSRNTVYVPVPGGDQIVIKHIISHKEAHSNA